MASGRPPASLVAARYHVGIGTDGNVGADTIRRTDASALPVTMMLWNPFDVTNGRAPETPDVIRRRAPEAFRTRQLRAITLADYRARAEELDFVQRAAAQRSWTGSWPTVRVTVDPVGGTELTDDQVERLAAHLDAVRLIGEDIEIRPPDFVPLDIRLKVCAEPRIWPEDLVFELEQAFSEGYTNSGEPGFFHPDLWTFGQKLYASQIIGRALEVEGVDRVLMVSMRPWDQAGGPSLSTIVITEADLPDASAKCIAVASNQVIRVANDPDALENGRMSITVQGGRR